MKLETMFDSQIQSDIIHMIRDEIDFEASAQVVGDFLSGYDLRYVWCLSMHSVAFGIMKLANVEMMTFEELFGF